MIDYYEDINSVHIVTELYSGGDLYTMIMNNTSDRGCLPEDEAIEIIKSILESVEYLHKKDIVHRDIKPERTYSSTRTNITHTSN